MEKELLMLVYLDYRGALENYVKAFKKEWPTKKSLENACHFRLVYSFIWGKTDQGHNYWLSLDEDLKGLLYGN